MTYEKRCEIVLLILAIKKHSICYTKRLGVQKRRAMGNSTLPTVLDKLCMVANINTRKLIEVIKAELKMKETKIQALTEMIDSLEAEDKRSGVDA